MNSLDVNVHDDLISRDFREKIWNYINDLKWFASWKPVPLKTFDYVPSKFSGNFYPGAVNRLPSMWMHRVGLASDDFSLEKKHPLIYDLWCQINQQLGNQYIIAGNDEEIEIPEEYTEYQPPPTKDLSLKTGWRVYCNAQLTENVKKSHGIHRDTHDVTDATTRTILYVANLEWYPSWFSECIFYPDDIEGNTGDHQQFQKNFYSQGRNFNIGWADEGKIVSPIPGRIINYDGRTLHTTRPAAIWAKEPRKVIAFRVRKK